MSKYQIKKYTTTEYVVAEVEDGAGEIMARCSSEKFANHIISLQAENERLQEEINGLHTIIGETIHKFTQTLRGK
jgi:hypothetical protein